MSIAEKLTGIAENQQKVFDAGKADEQKAFWDEFQQNGSRTNYNNAFQNWRGDIYNPIYPIVATSASYMYNLCTTTDTKVPIDVSKAKGSATYLFAYAQRLETINKVVVAEDTVYTNWFSWCNKLKNITFEGTIGRSIDFSPSTLLSRESIENIASCLSESASGATLTLSQTAVNNAFTEDEWNALIADKTNWTFSLV